MKRKIHAYILVILCMCATFLSPLSVIKANANVSKSSYTYTVKAVGAFGAATAVSPVLEAPGSSNHFTASWSSGSWSGGGKSGTVPKTSGTSGDGKVAVWFGADMAGVKVTVTLKNLKLTSVNCSGGTQTCTAGAVCSVCGKTYAGALGHAAYAAQVTPATCTSAGIYHNYCSRCGGSLSDNYYSGNALGHSASAKLVSAATCTTAAVYHDTCNRCGVETRGNYASGGALGHSFTSQTVNSTYLRFNATCTAPATYFYKCSRCSAKGTTFYNSGSALGHSNNNVWVTTKEPTCLEDGSKHTNCTRCGSDMNVTAIPKLGHVDNGVWVTETESTCTGTGSKHTNCARCNAILNETVLDALGHVWDSGIITTAPTVYRTGIRTFTCQTCHDTVTEIEPQYQFTIFAGTTRVTKIAKGTSILFENTTNTDDRLPFIVSTGTATHE